jgi:cell wall assembly regulator SMI1
MSQIQFPLRPARHGEAMSTNRTEASALSGAAEHVDRLWEAIEARCHALPERPTFGPPVSSEVLRAFEAELGAVLPEEYHAFLARHDPNARCGRGTALHAAAQWGHDDALALLVCADGDPLATDAAGDTVIEVARRQNRWERLLRAIDPELVLEGVAWRKKEGLS